MVDVRKSKTYNLLTHKGTRPVLCDNGMTSIPAEEAADVTQAICTMLAGRGYTHHQIATLLMIAGNAFRDIMDEEVRKAHLIRH